MSWKVTLPCTRQEAEALHDEDEWLASLDPVPSVVADEVEAFNDAKWRIEAYFPEKPDKAVVSLIQSRLPSAAKAKAIITKLPDHIGFVVLDQAHRLDQVDHQNDPRRTDFSSSKSPSSCADMVGYRLWRVIPILWDETTCGQSKSAATSGPVEPSLPPPQTAAPAGLPSRSPATPPAAALRCP